MVDGNVEGGAEGGEGVGGTTRRKRGSDGDGSLSVAGTFQLFFFAHLERRSRCLQNKKSETGKKKPRRE